MKMSTWKIAIATFAALATMIVPAQAGNPNCTEVDGDYIVSFPRGANLGNEMKAAAGRQIETKFTYDSVLNGFAATLTSEQACAFKKRPGATVELDGIATTMAVKTLTSNYWGLDRIDQKTRNLDNAFNVDSSGTGVFAFIFDTGIRSTHEQFNNANARVSSNGYDAIKDGRNLDDCNGHGTHVAGTVGGKDTGVASAVTLVPIRVLGCSGSGSWSGIIAGLDYVAKDSRRPAVVSMSIGGKLNKTLNSSVQNFILKSGIPVVVAAGNDGRDACQFSPAAVPEAITVGATDKNDNLASFSNRGKCVDVYAPGVGIYSSVNTNDSSYASWNGTSMATPHVTGVVARFLEKNVSGNYANSLTAINGAKSPTSVAGVAIVCLTGTKECSSN